nr:uncharacterized protein CTRU02_08984 [Colletotrichum truncatum]KAF6789192.1 hypothetical protein CTRU02_08984 [Colletotrichum truncatum]
MQKSADDIKIRESIRLVLKIQIEKSWIRSVSQPRYKKTKEMTEAWFSNLNRLHGQVEIAITIASEQMLFTTFLQDIEREFEIAIRSPREPWAAAEAFFQDPLKPNQLGWQTLDLENPKPKFQNPAMVAFHEPLSRMLTLQMSSYEELGFELAAAYELEKYHFQSVLIPDTSSCWSGNENEFGVKPDGTYMRYLAVMTCIPEEQRSLLPEIGTPFKVTLKVDSPTQRLPTVNEDDSEGDLRSACQYLIEKARDFQIQCDTETSGIADTEQISKAILKRDLKMIGSIVACYPSSLPQDITQVPEYVDLSEDGLKAVLACRHINSFFPLQEDDEEWTSKLMACFAGSLTIKAPASQELPRWKAVRLPVPRDACTSSVYLQIHTPCEEDWPQEFSSPPMKFNLELPILTGDLNQYVTNASYGHTKELIMHVEPTTTTTREEMDAVQAMASAESRLRVDGPYEALTQSLGHLPAGMMLYTGGPGSGKTTFAIKLLRQLTSSPGFRAIWCVQSNELCDDAAEKLAANVPADHIVARVYPIKRTIAAISGRLNDVSQPTATKESLKGKCKVECTVIKHITETRKAINGINPLARRDSIAVIALTMAHKNREKFREFWALREKHNLSQGDWQELQTQSFRLLSWVLTKPRVVVVDEVGKMPESQFWIFPTFFAPDLILAFGDTHQLKPTSKSFDNHGKGEKETEWSSLFGHQRKMSILRRAEKAGATISHIKVNNRNLGHIGDWAKMNVYESEMILKRFYDPLVEIFRRDIGRIIRCEYATMNSFIVDIPEGKEQPCGTSYTNSANRNYVKWLINKLFATGFPSVFDVTKQGTVMVITDYTSQLSRYQSDWARLALDDNIRKRVTFRTVDSSMSAEADIVIRDIVRTESLGFTTDLARMNVATTRARGAMITILSTKNWTRAWSSKGKGKVTYPPSSNNMVSYFNGHVDRRAVVDYGFGGQIGWKSICVYCGRPNHFKEECDDTASQEVIGTEEDHGNNEVDEESGDANSEVTSEQAAGDAVNW